MELSFKIYEHAAALLRRTPWEVSRDPGLLFEAHAAAYRLYGHRPILPAIDHYNLEAEAYGAEVIEPGGFGIPATRPKLASLADLVKLAPLDPRRDGRLPMLLDVAARLAREFPEAAVALPLSGPFSIASALLGFTSLLCELAADPGFAAEALLRLVEGQVALAQQAQRHGLDVVFCESAACPPFLSPAMFRGVELPALKAVVTRVSEILGHPAPCTMGGDTAPILNAILETGTRYVLAPFETDQATFLKQVWDRTEIHVRVNTKSTLIARGTWDEIRADADRIVNLLRGRPNVSLGAGVLPYETRPEVVLRLREYLAPF